MTAVCGEKGLQLRAKICERFGATHVSSENCWNRRSAAVERQNFAALVENEEEVGKRKLDNNMQLQKVKMLYKDGAEGRAGDSGCGSDRDRF